MRIKGLRKEKGWTQNQLAEKIGVSRSTVAMWETGGNEPDNDTLVKLSILFGCTTDYILEKTDSRFDDWMLDIINTESEDQYDSRPNTIRMKRIPILGDTAAGAPIIANREYDEYIEVPMDGRRFDAAVRVTGDSMEPGYRIGDLALLKYQDDVEDGQIAVVCLDEEVTLKRVYHNDHGILLISDNQKYAPMAISSGDVANIHLTGRAIGVLHWED